VSTLSTLEEVKSVLAATLQLPDRGAALSDATRFAEAAGAANVNVTLEVWPHMIHAWPLWSGGLAEGRDALTHAGRFIRRHLGLSTIND
jgi:acetyl esterase/lipase